MAGSPAGSRALIATQSSAFKDAVTTGLVEHLRDRSSYVKVIVVIHTWEMRKPPAEVQALADRTQKQDKLVVLTTSGAGNFKLAGVDAISAASQMADVTARVEEMIARIDAILNPES